MMLSDPVESSGIVGRNFPFDLRIEALHRFEPGNRASSLLRFAKALVPITRFAERLTAFHPVASRPAYMQNVDGRGFVINLKNDSVHVRLSAIEKMSRGWIFGSYWGSVWVLFKAEDSFLKSVKPSCRLLG